MQGDTEFTYLQNDRPDTNILHYKCVFTLFAALRLVVLSKGRLDG